jgi:hypothetical protein
VAQVDRVTCGSNWTPGDNVELNLLFESGIYDPPVAPGGAWEVPITFHVVRRSDGTGGTAQFQINQAIIDLNLAFASAGMVFCQMGPVQYIDSDAFYFNIDSDDEINDLRKTNPVPGTINVYSTQNLANDDGEICGISSFSWKGTQGIVMWNDCFGIPGNLRFAHEVGHYFNLLHTHGGGCCCNLSTCAECTDGSNCGCCGDTICDTPADPLLYDIQTMEFLVDGNCQYTGDVDPPCQGDPPYDPDVTNIMSYAPSSCLVGFTQIQNNRMLATLIHKRFELITTDCAYSGICGAGAGPCPEPHEGRGCLDATCCSIVCDADIMCCKLEWDLDCALLAQQICDLGPEHDDCDDAMPLYSDPQFYGFDTTYAGTDGPSHPECNGQVDSDIWFNYRAPCTGDLTLSLCDTADFDTRLAVYGMLNCPVSFIDLLACNDDGQGCGGGTSEVTLPVILDELLKIRVGGAGLAEGTGTLFFDCKTQFDDCDSPLVLFGYEGPVNVNTIGATTDGGFFCVPSKDIWMDYYPPCTGVLQIDRVADFDMAISAYDNCDCPADPADSVLCNGSGFHVVENQCYKIQIGGLQGDEGTGQVTFTCNPFPPNDECADAIEVGPGDVVNVNNDFGTTDGPLADGTCTSQITGEDQFYQDVWYAYTATCDAEVTFSMCNAADFDVAMAVYEGCTCVPTDNDRLACSDNAPGCGETAEVTVDVVEGQCYLVRVGTVLPGDTGDAQLTIEQNPDCQGDADGDGIIGILDFLIVIGTWGQCPPPCPPSCPADFDGDCEVGVTDFLLVLANWT